MKSADHNELPAMSKRGFTLIELLVVVTIIVVLLALLVPAMDKAIEQAERAQCAASLHAWGAAVPQYSFENKRKLLSTVRFGIATGPGDTYPNLAWARRGSQALDWSDAATKTGQWCTETMQPYVGGVDLVNLEWKGLWYCPSNGAGRKDAQAKVTAGNSDWIVSDYAYFARVDQWRAYATRPEELTAHNLSSGRLLMADAIYYERSPGWWFNHGPDGWSTHHADWGGPVQQTPNIYGTNQLFGDGSVRWIDASLEDVTHKVKIPPDLEGHWVSSNTDGAGNPRADANFNFYLK